AAVFRAAGRPDEAIELLSKSADRPLTPAMAGHEKANFGDTARQYGFGSRSWVFGTDERFRFWVELGDLLSELVRHREAADRFDQGWKRYPDNPVLLYLSGRALVKAGDEKEGRRRIDLSHWVALG